MSREEGKRNEGQGCQVRGTVTKSSFAVRLLGWWEMHGRHDFPWQVERSPYRVWLSEIMLQQTQAATVIAYFERFTTRFPDLKALANADLDEVMALWSGLGYYARARNLHKAARICRDQYGGRLPDSADELVKLPGIGQSTANAIIAQAHDRRAPILDGNVKRVLARHAGIEGWPGRSAVSKALWDESDRCTPAHRARDYTQAIMDLGAAICRPRNPACGQCPLASDCIALHQGLVDEIPGRKPKRKRPHRSVRLAIIESDQGRILLERRPPAGIWGGLWSLPQATDLPDAAPGRQLESIEHHFTHFVLHIHPVHFRMASGHDVADGADRQWVKAADALGMGLPRPIRTIMESLADCPA